MKAVPMKRHDENRKSLIKSAEDNLPFSISLKDQTVNWCMKKKKKKSEYFRIS